MGIERGGGATPKSDLIERIAIEARGIDGDFARIGLGFAPHRYTSDLWVHGGYAYTGTWGCLDHVCGNRLNVWDVSNPAAPVLTDSVVVVAQRVMNDVKVSPDGTVAVVTHEFSADGEGGVTLLDLSDPAHPTVITRYTEDLGNGVHNLWIEDGYLYVVEDLATGGLHILDISNPAEPVEVAFYYGGTSFLHDVYVRDGLAFLSHWDAGLIILDVGNGIAGGSPTDPAVVSRIRTAGGETHNAWYWPEAGYVFVGEEDFSGSGADGYGGLHVNDVSDLRDPVEVASFSVAGDSPHNIWLEEENAILYAAWYSEGLYAIDVSGTLVGELEKQGRVYAHIVPEGPRSGGIASANRLALHASCHLDCGASALTDGTAIWAPQPAGNGIIFASDMANGLWTLSFEVSARP